LRRRGAAESKTKSKKKNHKGTNSSMYLQKKKQEKTEGTKQTLGIAAEGGRAGCFRLQAPRKEDAHAGDDLEKGSEEKLK